MHHASGAVDVALACESVCNNATSFPPSSRFARRGRMGAQVVGRKTTRSIDQWAREWLNDKAVSRASLERRLTFAASFFFASIFSCSLVLLNIVTSQMIPPN